jgi:hypothetical protein
MRRHVALKIEVSQFISLLQLQKGRQLGIRIDLASIVLVLKLVGTDISVNLTSNIGAGHLGSSRLLKELGKLIGNLGWLHEPRWLAVSGLALALSLRLLGSLNLTTPLLLQRTELGLQRSEQCTSLVKLGKEFSRLGNKVGIRFRNSGSGFGGNRCLNDSGFGLSNRLGGLRGLSLRALVVLGAFSAELTAGVVSATSVLDLLGLGILYYITMTSL